MSEKPGGSVGRGILIALGLHLLQIGIIPAAIYVSNLLADPKTNEYGVGGIAIALGGFCITQFLYLGPALWFFNRKGQKETVKGILIVAGIGVLLNSGCDALIFSR